MFPEQKVADLVGCTREELASRREGRASKVERQWHWTLQGVEALLSELGISSEKIPAGALEALRDEVAAEKNAPRPEPVELEVYRTTGNPGIILCRVNERVVRCRIKPGTAPTYRPRMSISAIQEVGDLYRVLLGRR